MSHDVPQPVASLPVGLNMQGKELRNMPSTIAHCERYSAWGSVRYRQIAP